MYKLSALKINSLIRKYIPAGLLYFVFLSEPVYAQNLPVGYINYYSQKANTEQFFTTITSCTPQYWNISNDKGSTILYPIEPDSLNTSAFPINMAVLKDMIFGEFIMEYEFQTAFIPDSNSEGFCFTGPVKSVDRYYACVFCKDSVTFCYINRGTVERIATKSIQIKEKSWNHIRITRDILKRSVTITLNKNLGQQVIFTDPRLVMGFIGFGTMTLQSNIRNINVWAPTVIADSTFSCY